MTLKILLVEDSPTQALRTRRMLEGQGFRVASAGNGKEALSLARRERPDVILSDILMPGMDGFQLCLEVRQDPELNNTPIVLQTASFNSEEDRRFALELGTDGYVEKTISPDALRAMLSEAVARRRGSLVDPATDAVLDERGFRDRYGDLMTSKLVQEAAELERLNDALAAAYDATLEALVAALDLRDTETEYHSWRVSEYSVTIARRLQLDDAFIRDLERGSLLHDIGKIGVPDHILRKPGPLDDEEWREMRRHPQLGYRMLAHIAFLEGAAEIVLTHHERWDGEGYPLGLAGEAIPIGARIFAVADTLDAITSNRPYRPGRDFDVALEEILLMNGAQFDPAVVDATLTIAAEDWRMIKHRVELRRRQRRIELIRHPGPWGMQPEGAGALP